MTCKIIRKNDCHEEDINIVFNELKDIEFKGIIHIGAHKGEEVEFYRNIGLKNIILIEANPNLFNELKHQPFFSETNVYNYAISNEDGEIDFYVHQSNAGVESSSIFKMNKFDKIVTSLHTESIIKVQTRKLNTLFEEENLSTTDYNILISDIQGADFYALLGASNILSALDALVVEVQFLELYDNYISIEKFDEYLNPFGFKKVLIIEHELYQGEEFFPGWGEVLYKKVAE
jgi:FkbM family methyltransferase